MKTLEQIATDHKTAKVPHGFMPIYERFFEPMRNKPVNLLEIGVATGASLRMWNEYFQEGTIIGIDKDLQYFPEHHQVFTFRRDAANPDDLKEVAKLGPFDIIVDDGSHYNHEQLISFDSLWGCLKPGGYYVVEDLFTLYDSVWNPDGNNILNLLHSRFRSIVVGGDSIQEMHLFGRNNINGILFLRKRYEPFRIQSLDEFRTE